MPTKRAILTALTRDELRAAVDDYDVRVDDRRVKTQLVDALAGSRRVRLDDLLRGLSRNRLKDLCRAFDVDDSGRRKATLVARLVGPPAASKSDGGADPSAASRPVVTTPDPSADTLSVAQLEQYLWSAADILRGSIDSSDYKTYIFGLLFLKRLSDRFEEEAGEAHCGGRVRGRWHGPTRTSTSSSCRIGHGGALFRRRPQTLGRRSTRRARPWRSRTARWKASSPVSTTTTNGSLATPGTATRCSRV